MAASIKAGTNAWLRVIFKDVDFDLVDSIEFMFKQDEDDEGTVLKTALWSAHGESRDAQLDESEEGVDAILIKWRKEDTYLFEQGESFYLDTRIHLNGSWDNPETNIVRLRMSNTLFESGEEAKADG